MISIDLVDRTLTARVLASAALLAMLAAPGQATAAFSPCMATAAGQPNLNCVANDLGVASFHITNVSEACTEVGDTMTFDGEVNLSAGTTNRYDLGFYIGFDSVQAYTGSCTVGIVPPSLVNLDGDNCGDFNKTPLAVPMTGVVATCSDSNHDGFYDLAICASYDQNANTFCNDSSGAVPGTGSKCQCAQVETDLEVPHCATNADCEDDGNLCTTEVCNSLQSGLGDLFGCSHDNNTLPCDDGVFCNGADACSGGSCAHAGNPCTGGPVCGNVCNEDAGNCLVAAGTTCRASAGVCDVTESCTGSTTTCPADTFLSTGDTCRESTGVCDPAESCTGSTASCPTNTLLTSVSICRSSTGICDIAERCSGSAGACPGDSFFASTDVCRVAVANCDAAENCTGTSGACPANTFVSSGTVCRAESGVCDVAESCTGSTATCPANAFVSSATECRAPGGVCDVAESCTGTSGDCPSDTLAGASIVCRDSTGVCDAEETCDGSTALCPADVLSSSLTVCRDSAGVCDVSESCTGTSGECPQDTMNDAETVCRGSTGVCDTDELCTGSTGSCPDDLFVPSETECRASGGVCDIAESCTGTTGDCPADTLVSSATICRDSTGVCDAEEACDGTSALCPADILSSSTTVCRESAGACDVAESCTGTGGSCPDEGFAPIDTPCTTDDNVCTDDLCDESGNCLHTDNVAPCDDGLFCTGDDVCSQGECIHDGDPCTEGGECADACNEAADSCFDPNTTPCIDDQNLCTNDFCDGLGTCAHTPNTVPCDDGVFCNGIDVCTGGACGHSGDPCLAGPQCQDVCDEEDDNCLDTDGDPCEKECTIPGTGVCADGECEGTDITLSPSCRWIVLGGVGPVQGGGTVKTTGVRNDAGSMLDGSQCGFFSFRPRGHTAGDLVVTAGIGEGFSGAGIKFGTNGEVAGDIVTGQSVVKGGAFQTVPGTGLATVGSNMLIERLNDLLQPTGTFVDTTGTHDLVEVCDDDQDKLAEAMEVLDALPATATFGKFKLKFHGALPLNANGLTVHDYTSFKVGGRSLLTLHGDADDVLIIRVAGDLKINYATNVFLDGLKPENVLFYGKGGKCKIAARVTGGGTVFCPKAKTFYFGFGSSWEGTALGGTREVRVRRNVDFLHKAFTAF